MLGAARSAPSTFIAELKRSAELFGIVFDWFQFPELYATGFSFFVKIIERVVDILSLVFVWFSEFKFLRRDFFGKAILRQKNFSKTGSCREAAKN